MTNHDKDDKNSFNPELSKKPVFGKVEQRIENLVGAIVEQEELELGASNLFTRDKNWYGLEQTVLLVSDIAVGHEDVRGTRMAFTKFNKLIMDQDDLYKKLGFVKEIEVDAKFANTTPVYFKSYREAARQGLVLEIEFILKSKTDRVWAPFGRSYKTTVPFSTRLPLINIGLILKTNIFKFGNTEYELKLGSVKEKKAKKTTPTFL